MTAGIVLAVGGVAIENDTMLLIKRATQPAAGAWSVPGGRVEVGETLAEAVARELREETGLTVTVGPLIAIAERIEAAHHLVIANHRVEVVGRREPTPGDDAADAAWVALDRLEELELVPGLLDYLRQHGIVS